MKRGLLLWIVIAGVTALMAQPQASYYTASTLDGKNGRALELALQSIVYPHTFIKYDKLWKAYETTDLAPADSIPSSYTGDYTKLVYDMYAWMQAFPKFYEENNHSQTGGINREHSVPNSWWGGQAGNDTAYTDLHHLVPSDGAANQAKQNYPLGEYASGLTLLWPTDTKAYQGRVYMNTTDVCSRVWTVPAAMRSTYGGSTHLFEPADMYKGDFARMYLYVVCAYEKKITWQTSENTMFSNDAQGYTEIAPWALATLLAWHRNDPVSQKECVRNNDVESLQNNRNPFIDYPELVEFIWGNKQTQSFSLSSAVSSYSSVYYAVEVADLTGGTVAVSPSSTTAGTTVTLVATPDRVHLFNNIAANWNVKDCENNPITVTIGAGNSCSFTMPAGDVTVSATFAVNPDAVHYIFEEDFSSVTKGSNTSTSGSSYELSAGNFDNFSAFAKVFAANDAVKLGTGTSAGSLTTKSLDLSQNGGRFVLQFDVKGWTSLEGDITVTVTGQTPQTFTYTAVMADEEFQTIRYVFTGGQAGSTITIATTSKRAFIDNIYVYYFRDMYTMHVTSAGWGTYYTEDSFRMPQGVTGYVATYSEPDLTLTPSYAAGTVVPGGTPLLIQAEAGDYPYYLAQSAEDVPETVLYGNPVAGVTPHIYGATHYYKLANGEDGLGWYWGAENHGVFALGAGKAYMALALEGSNAPMHFGLPTTDTGITELTEPSATTDIDWTRQVYNVLGQPVRKGAKGILIQNGTKYVVK